MRLSCCFSFLPLSLVLWAAPPDDAVRAAFEEGVSALAANDLDTSERSFAKVLRARPSHAGALGNLGVVYTRMNRFADAVRVYRRALKLAPTDAQLNVNLGLAYLKQDDYKSAKPHLQTALSAMPNHAQTRELLAAARLFTGEVELAAAELEALPSGPSVLYLRSIAYLKQGRKEEARKTMAELFNALPPAQAHFLAGRAYYESTLFDQAAAELEKARKLDPALTGLSRELGKTYISLRRVDEAREILQEADPADIEARYFLGALLVQEGAIAEGVLHLDQARKARPEFWGSYYYLGKAALSRTDYAESVRLLRKASELDPNNVSVLYQLVRALKLAGMAGESSAIARQLSKVRAKTREHEQALVER